MRSRLGDDGRVKPNWRGPGGADLHSGQGLAAMADGLNVRPPTFSNHHIARLLTSLPRGACQGARHGPDRTHRHRIGYEPHRQPSDSAAEC